MNQLELLDDGGTANYEGLLLSLQHRLASHFTVLGNYTWSHCIADLVTTELGVPLTPIRTDRRADRASACAGVDVRHNVNLSAVAESPRFSERWLRYIAGDWQLSVIASAHSGSFFTVTTGVDNALTGISGQRPNQVLTNPYCTSQSINCWINALAFTSPTNGTTGSLGVGNIEGPGYFDVDLGLPRRFMIHEKQHIEIRGEAFNIQNRANFANPTSALNSATFGKILSDVSPRIMQFAIKYQF